MLVIDISNVMHTGMRKSIVCALDRDNTKYIKCIPYLFSKVAAYASQCENVVFAFDPDPDDMGLGAKIFPTHRTRDPAVVWESRMFREVCRRFQFPIIEANGYSADSLVYSVLTEHEHDRENHFIMSNDQDLACNVKWRNNGDNYTAMLGFSTKGYYVEPSDFKHIYGIPYNFMNIDKLLSGCASDKIPAGTDSRILRPLFKDYLMEILSLETNTTVLNMDVFSERMDVFRFNTIDFFMEFLTEYAFRKDLIPEYTERAKAIYPKKKEIGPLPRMNWELFNAVAQQFTGPFGDTFLKYGIKELTDMELGVVNDIKQVTPMVKSHVFISDVDKSGIRIESGVLDDLKILEELDEGDL